MLKLLPYLAVLFVRLKNSKKIRKNISCWQKFDILDIQKKEKRKQTMKDNEKKEDEMEEVVAQFENLAAAFS